MRIVSVILDGLTAINENVPSVCLLKGLPSLWLVNYEQPSVAESMETVWLILFKSKRISVAFMPFGLTTACTVRFLVSPLL
jgi:hypothetical protein